MGVELTWVALAASISMGLAGVCLFIYAVKKDYFRNIEETKYQVFWSDLDELVRTSMEKKDEPSQPNRHPR
jgi:hypothetical protein